MTMRPLKVLSIFGTRPEAIKMAPVSKALLRQPARFESLVCATSQQRQMQDQAMNVFGIEADHDLDLMRPGQSLDHVVSAVLSGVGEVISSEKPDWVLVQGDTSTAFAAGLAAFHAGVSVGHVEAGLRTHSRQAPYPEEVNRRMLSSLADLHFAPTQHARDNLLAEGYNESEVVVTGNTVVDSLQWVLGHPELEFEPLPNLPMTGKSILITGHRRESFGSGFDDMCYAIKLLAARNPACHFVYPVHLNPRVQQPVRAILGGLPNVHLIDPLPYVAFVRLMQRVDFIISDSGGIQEEATALGKPVLVMREVTERPEGVHAGVTKLVGTDPDRIVPAAQELIDDESISDLARGAVTTYGDGRAALRIVEALARIRPHAVHSESELSTATGSISTTPSTCTSQATSLMVGT